MYWSTTSTYIYFALCNVRLMDVSGQRSDQKPVALKMCHLTKIKFLHFALPPSVCSCDELWMLWVLQTGADSGFVPVMSRILQCNKWLKPYGVQFSKKSKISPRHWKLQRTVSDNCRCLPHLAVKQLETFLQGHTEQVKMTLFTAVDIWVLLYCFIIASSTYRCVCGQFVQFCGWFCRAVAPL